MRGGADLRPDLRTVLEPAQLSEAREKLPRRKLGRGTLVLLCAMRVYVVIAIPIVIYAFVRALAG